MVLDGVEWSNTCYDHSPVLHGNQADVFCLHLQVHLCVHACVLTHMYVCVCVCVCARARACVRARANVILF